MFRPYLPVVAPAVAGAAAPPVAGAVVVPVVVVVVAGVVAGVVVVVFVVVEVSVPASSDLPQPTTNRPSVAAARPAIKIFFMFVSTSPLTVSSSARSLDG